MFNGLGHDARAHPNDTHAALPDIIGWDVDNWSQALAFWNDRARIPTAASCLELGCGSNSSLSLWLALLGNSVVCSDFGGAPESTKATHRRYGVADRITYADVDAHAIPYKNQFDLIVFKSMLGGVVREDPSTLSRAIAQGLYDALKPGGMLLFAENLRSTPLHHFSRSYFVGRKAAWHYFELAEIERMLNGFRSFEFTTFGFLGCFGRSERQRRLLAKLDTSVLDKLVPARWHYIAAAIAYK